MDKDTQLIARLKQAFGAEVIAFDSIYFRIANNGQNPVSLYEEVRAMIADSGWWVVEFSCDREIRVVIKRVVPNLPPVVTG